MKRSRGGLNFAKKRRKFNKPLFKEILIWVVELALAIGIGIGATAAFGTRIDIVGSSMESELANGEKVLVNKIAYTLVKPKRGDVIVFLPNGNEKSHYYVRRVVAVGGDEIQIKNGAVYVNGELYEEETDVVSIEDAGIASEVLKLEKGEYFVLGDNRNNSEDSRFANIGMVKKEYIVGKAWLHIKSKSKIGIVK